MALVVAAIVIFGVAFWQIHFTVRRLFATDTAMATLLPVFAGPDEKESCIVLAPDGLLLHAHEMSRTDMGIIVQADQTTSSDDLAGVQACLRKAIISGEKITLVCSQLPTELLEDRKGPVDAAATAREDVDMLRWRQVLTAIPRRRRVSVTAREDLLCVHEAVWNNATRRQKVTIFQLAHDGLVNPNNSAVLRTLMERGVVLQGDAPHLFGSFAAYVREIMPLESADQWQQPESTTTWTGVRLVFLVLGIAILVVALLFAQQHFLAAVVTGLSPLVPIVSGVLRRGKEGSAEG